MATPSFRRILIANRGEIAVRIIRACEALGIESVAAVSAADRDSLAARRATRAVCIGPAPAAASYLRPETLVAAALGTGCGAVHPGYGFLSERAAFARLCGEAGLVFIGPSPDAIAAMGDKLSALAIAEAAGVARVPGSDRLSDIAEARRAADRIGYPVLVKASAGGGGRGMRIVESAAELGAAIESAGIEAEAAFGDATLYLEKFIRRARHIEVQILGDAAGTVVHFGDRECSTQRRHQKLIEEAPAPTIDAETRRALADAALSLARHVRYQGAGTVEFVYDEESRAAYFLEMNTRIQVEHPVSEMVTGHDLVEAQIRVAAGETVPLAQDDLRIVGHAIECRINAEDVAHNFAPRPGRIAAWRPPEGPGVRVDTHCHPGYLVPPFYDSLLAKLIVHASDRERAVALMTDALDRFEIEGIPTTLPFHRSVLRHADFRDARVTTRWVEERFLAA
jgi:acetyl-CoA carboxylase biotin carboxylase subunit